MNGSKTDEPCRVSWAVRFSLSHKLMAASGKGIVREFEMDRYTLLYLKWITNHELLYFLHLELCSVLCGSLVGRGVWGRMDTCM